jgi:hypothetical protein
VNASLRIPGMECCSTHNSAYSSVTEVGHMPSVETVPRAKQGTHMAAARDVVDGRAENLHRGSVAPSAFWVPCCRTRSGAISKGHTAEESRAGLIWAGCTGSDGGASRRALPLG